MTTSTMSFSTATFTLTGSQFVLAANILHRNGVASDAQLDSAIEAANDELTASHNVTPEFANNVIRFTAMELSKNYQEHRFASHIKHNIPACEVEGMLEDCKTVHSFLNSIINVEDALDADNLNFANLLHHAKINLAAS